MSSLRYGILRLRHGTLMVLGGVAAWVLAVVLSHHQMLGLALGLGGSCAVVLGGILMLVSGFYCLAAPDQAGRRMVAASLTLGIATPIVGTWLGYDLALVPLTLAGAFFLLFLTRLAEWVEGPSLTGKALFVAVVYVLALLPLAFGPGPFQGALSLAILVVCLGLFAHLLDQLVSRL